MKVKLRQARLAVDLSCADVARQLNVARSTVSSWENPNKKALPSRDKLNDIAVIYQTTVNDLMDFTQSNVVATPEHAGSVPLVAFEDIKRYMDIGNRPHIFCPTPCGPDTYATKVVGDSMRSDNALERSYPDGTYIFCDPDASIENGCRIIAILESGVTVFREYRREEGRTWLRSLNRDYPHITEPFITLAVVIGSFRKE